MADIKATNSNLEKTNVSREVVFNAATTDTANEAQKIVINNDNADDKTVVVIQNGAGGVLSYKFVEGEMPGAMEIAGTIEANKTVAIEVENLKVSKNNGDVELILTPATGKKLLSDHAVKVAVIGLI